MSQRQVDMTRERKLNMHMHMNMKINIHTEQIEEYYEQNYASNMNINSIIVHNYGH